MQDFNLLQHTVIHYCLAGFQKHFSREFQILATKKESRMKKAAEQTDSIT